MDGRQRASFAVNDLWPEAEQPEATYYLSRLVRMRVVGYLLMGRYEAGRAFWRKMAA